MYLRKTYRTVRNVTFCALASIKLRAGYRGSGGAVLTPFLVGLVLASWSAGSSAHPPASESRLPSGDGRRAGPASTLVRLRASGPPRGHSARYNTTTAHTDDRPRSKAACKSSYAVACTARPGTRTGILQISTHPAPARRARRRAGRFEVKAGRAARRGLVAFSSCWAVAVAA